MHQSLIDGEDSANKGIRYLQSSASQPKLQSLSRSPITNEPHNSDNMYAKYSIPPNLEEIN